MKFLSTFSCLLVIVVAAAAFTPCHYDSHGGSHEQLARSASSSTSSTQLNAWFPDNGMLQARGSFPLWLFGAVGSGGVARKAIPDLIDDWKEVQALKGLGPTLGGPRMSLSPLVGFPEDICIKDVEQIVNNKLSVEQIVQKYPQEGNFLSDIGYLTLSAFQEANANSNPLAVRAVFDSFQKSKVVEPEIAQARIDEYKSDATKVASNLNVAKFKVFSAVFALLFLLGLADITTATDAYHGWFPDWPGGQNFPFRLLTADGNPFTIPQYWVNDIPEELLQ